MTSIEETIRASLTQHGYDSPAVLEYAVPVITALENRERRITTTLLAYATAEGFNVEAVRQALDNAGLVVPRTGVTPGMPDDPFVDQPLTGQHLAETLERLSRQIDSLTTFARANGFRG
jgi:hypothetical protein